MAYIESILKRADVCNDDHLIYVGFDANELNTSKAVHKENQFSGPFLGDDNNGIIKVYPDHGDEYTLVFKAKLDIPFARGRHAFQTLFDDKDRLMICVNGTLYRYQVNSKNLKSMIDYECPQTSSSDYYSLCSQEHQIMIIVTTEGLVAVDWDSERWKLDFSWSYCGYLLLKSIRDNILHITYEAPSDLPREKSIYLNILTGDIIKDESI